VLALTVLKVATERPDQAKEKAQNLLHKQLSDFGRIVTVITFNYKRRVQFLSVGRDKQLANRRRCRASGFPWKGEDMISKMISVGAVAFALTVGAASISSAATCGSGLTGVGNFVEGQTACVTGNDIGTAGGGNPRDSYVDMFGMGKTWNVLNPTNLGQPQAEGGDTILQFSGFSVSPDNGGTVSGAGTMGTWSVTSWPTNTLIAFALKGGAPNSGGGSTFHLMDQSTTSGKW
jgi:hypothetical protein